MKTNLTDRYLKGLKPAPAGKRYDVGDVQTPGLILRVNDKGLKVWALQSRFPGSDNPVRRALGTYPDDLSLSAAREKARAWRALLKDGLDPGHVEDDRRRERRQAAATTFEHVAEAFIASVHRKGQRKAGEVEKDLRREFFPRWSRRPITSITPGDVVEVIDAVVARDATYQAHNLLGTIRRLFLWALSRDTYGLKTSPCDRLKPREIIGTKAHRTRILNDDELQAFWKATALIDYPYGQLFRLLLLTIQRKSEVAEGVWSEFDLVGGIWTLPPARMKSATPHVLPLPPAALEIIKALPRFAGPHLFSTTAGWKPVNGFSKAKEILDRLMLAELQRAAAARGDNPDSVVLAPFVLHDLRRTGRTHLSALPIPDMVRELVIAHAKPGLHRVYDQFQYLEEKRDALKMWADRLLAIVGKAP